ncbi:MAG: F0F1 ATP synthase subunit gamma [Lentisphaerae bacterium]|jgi:F-type H+-transporting ATPase subunit gamma|nr:F0F1 ATP synthase subunit gamma [Lentisphaerota bacterium]
MADLSEYTAKLESTRSMGRVMTTMKMVSTSHFHRAQKELHRPEQFMTELHKLLVRLVQDPKLAKHPLLMTPEDQEPKILLFVVTSDRGLCGSFNSSVIRQAREWTNMQRSTRQASVYAHYIGMKGYKSLQNEIRSASSPVSVEAHPTLRHSSVPGAFAFRTFMDGRYNEVWVVGNKYLGATAFRTKVSRIFPLSLPEGTGKIDLNQKVIIEPDATTILVSAARMLVSAAIYSVQLNCAVSEHSSRMLAMDSAEKNLEQMQKETILLRNRARQAAITNELNEIVAGSEALDI